VASSRADAATDGGGQPVLGASELTEFMTEGFGRPWTWPIERVDARGVRLRLPAAEVALRPGGTVSGPTLMTLADSAAYLVVLSQLGPAALAVTTNLNINFLHRPLPGDLVAEATLLRSGRTLVVSEVEIHSPDDPTRPVAHATVTYSTSLVTPVADPARETQRGG